MALGDSSAYFRMQATVLDRIEKCPNVDPCILNFDEADKEELTFVQEDDSDSDSNFATDAEIAMNREHLDIDDSNFRLRVQR